jgi:hypothetical protein
MAEDSAPNSSDFLSPEDLRHWFQQEKADIAKASELRLKEAQGFVTAYAEGKITPDEVEDRLFAYSQRWGEVLPGTHTAPTASDEEIIKSIDEARNRILTNATKRTGWTRD